MTFSAKCCCLLSGVLLLVGCSKKDEANTTDGSSGAPAATSATATPTPIPTPVAPPKPVNNEADAAAIRNCCAALRKAADTEKNAVAKGTYTSSASVCDSHVNNVKNGSVSRSSALSSIRGSMRGKTLPAGCN